MGTASTIKPTLAGTLSISISRTPNERIVAHFAVRVSGRVPREIGNGRGRDRHAEDADRHVHQPKRVAERRHRAGLGGRERRVDQEIDLRGGHAERARSHEDEHRAQVRIGRIENPLVPVALLPERRPLHGNLRHAAEQHRDRERHDRLDAASA